MLEQKLERFVAQVRGRLIVSCQAQAHEPLHGSAIMARMALAAAQGGAAAIRANTPPDIRAIRAAVDLPIQAQCEPPDDPRWFERLRAAGVDTLGMHLEAVTPEVRARIMPGKATVPLAVYWQAFERAVEVFGRGQVSTYLLAGLGDPPAAILAACERLVALGVYPFVVPFVPIAGTPLEDHPAPSAAFMRALLEPLGAMLEAAGLRAADSKAGCGRCGACSTLSLYGG